MVLKISHLVNAVCILIILFSVACFTAGAEYIITPYVEDSDVPPELVDSSGADGTLTFWELPLYFKLITIFCFVSVWPLSLVKFLPFLLGKMKFDKGEENRERIYSYVSANPGCSESDILKALDMKRGTFRYHADRLKQANMLVCSTTGRFTRYFRRDFPMENKVRYLDLNMKNDTRKNVLETIIEEPGVTGKDLCSRLGVDKSTIHWHVNKLDEENIIRSERHGKFKRYYPGSNLQTVSDNIAPVLSD